MGGGTKLTFKLRQGVKWHDGKPFTAKDVRCTWHRLLGKEDDFRKNPRIGTGPFKFVEFKANDSIRLVRAIRIIGGPAGLISTASTGASFPTEPRVCWPSSRASSI